MRSSWCETAAGGPRRAALLLPACMWLRKRMIARKPFSMQTGIYSKLAAYGEDAPSEVQGKACMAVSDLVMATRHGL
jgi:hypothetical protein